MKYSNDTTRLVYEEPTIIIVTDPCYIITHRQERTNKIWQALCGEWYINNKPAFNARQGSIEIEDRKILYSSTKWGDGTYKVSHIRHPGKIIGDNEICVDAGMICVTTLDTALYLNPELRRDLYTLIHGFKGEIISTGDGFIKDLIVNTDLHDEEDEQD